MALRLAGYEEKEIFEMISESFNEKSREKLVKLGFKLEEMNFYELDRAFDKGTSEITLKEQISMPQKSNESVQIYLKRLKKVLPGFGDELPSSEEFLDIFKNGLHPNLRESNKVTLLEQMKRLPLRNLKETIEQLESVLKVISESCKDRSFKPLNTCAYCKERLTGKPVDLDDIDEVGDFSD